jgi:two-component system OmpR family response regulator
MTGMSKARILFVDDDERICRLVKRYVVKNNYDIVCAHNSKDARYLLRNETIALILLDVMLPDTDGFTLAQEIRKKSTTPIIFLTAKAEINDKVSGLEIGADDYITKPFEEKELIARIQTVLRRTQQTTTATKTNNQLAKFSGWSLDLLKQTLSSPEGKNIEITSTEYTLLSKLVSLSNNTISREEILNILSGREWSPLDRSADMAISKLRKKIEKDPRKPEIIKTIRNKGYQLTAAVNYIEA